MEAVPEISLPPRPPPVDSLPRLDRSAPVEVDKPLVAPIPISPPVAPPKISPPAPEPEIAPRAAPLPPPPREVPAPVATPVEAIAPAKIEREQAPAAEVKPRDVPMPNIAPTERIAPPKIERNVAPPVEPQVPRLAPVETTAPARVAPIPERESAPAAQPLPRSEPVEIAPARERAAPAAVVPGKAPSTPTPARTEAPTGGELPRLRFGAPDVDDEVFRSRRDVVAPTAEPGGAPAITAESLRKRAGEIAREGSGSRGVLNLVPPPPPRERKDKLAEDIAKAAKPDCRTAYADMGLLAVVPLVASTVGNGGCRW